MPHWAPTRLISLLWRKLRRAPLGSCCRLSSSSFSSWWWRWRAAICGGAMVVLAGAVEGAICFFSLLPAAACRSSLPLCLLACCCVVLPAGGPPPPARRCCCVIFVHSRYAQVYFRPSHPATKNGLQLSTSSMMCAVCCSLLICCAACANLTCYLPRKNVKSAHQQSILCPLKFSFSVSIIFILFFLLFTYFILRVNYLCPYILAKPHRHDMLNILPFLWAI